VNAKSTFLEPVIVIISALSFAIVMTVIITVAVIIPVSAAVIAGDLKLIRLSARQSTIAKLRLN
jgi:hypothetical protein